MLMRICWAEETSSTGFRAVKRMFWLPSLRIWSRACSLAPLADREHRDDTGDAEDHAQHRQQGPEHVQPQCLEARANIPHQADLPHQRTSILSTRPSRMCN